MRQLTRKTASSVTTPQTRYPERLPFLLAAFFMISGMFIASPRALAQTNYGAIVGTVKDATGADLVGAEVTLKNNGTDATETVKSGSGGTYTFLNLNPGSYSLIVSNPGFK
jgi:hypothetical protein